MSDTEPAVAAMLERLWAERSAGERIAAACAMFTTARQCMRAGIAAAEPGLTEAETRVREFRRLYAAEFDSVQMGQIEARIRGGTL